MGGLSLYPTRVRERDEAGDALLSFMTHLLFMGAERAEDRSICDAIDCMEAPEGSSARSQAIVRCAFNPSIFQEIRGEYEGSPSEHNLRFFLIKRGYTAEAASKAAQNYLATVRLVEESGGSYDATSEKAEPPMEAHEPTAGRSEPRPVAAFLKAGAEMAQRQQGLRQSVFPLDEGDVTLTFPANLSSEGYAELAEYMEIFLRRAQRSKRAEEESTRHI